MQRAVHVQVQVRAITQMSKARARDGSAPSPCPSASLSHFPAPPPSSRRSLPISMPRSVRALLHLGLLPRRTPPDRKVPEKMPVLVLGGFVCLSKDPGELVRPWRRISLEVLRVACSGQHKGTRRRSDQAALHYSPILATLGTIGAPISFLSKLPQSTPANHGWFITSFAPPLRFPSRLLLSAVNKPLIRSLAYGSM
jgi:hypothetical protein